MDHLPITMMMMMVRIITTKVDLCQEPGSALLLCYLINLLPALEDRPYSSSHFADEVTEALIREGPWPGEQCRVELLPEPEQFHTTPVSCLLASPGGRRAEKGSAEVGEKAFGERRKLLISHMEQPSHLQASSKMLLAPSRATPGSVSI